MNAIEISQLSKSYKDFKLDNLSFSLPYGSTLGLICEIGAGKSTTIKLILNMIKRDSGTISLLGKNNTDNLCELKEEIGVVLDEMGISGGLTATQIGKIMKYSFSNWQEETYYNYLKKLDIPENKRFGEFSKGMKMKLQISVALSHGAKLLLLDEPTGGLDPVVRDEVVDIFNEFTRDGNRSILISSHIVSDLEKMCDYIAFIHKGKLLLCEDKNVLTGQYGIIRCTENELMGFNESSIIGKKKTDGGFDVIIRKDDIPSNAEISQVSIEELFVFMVRGGETL